MVKGCKIGRASFLVFLQHFPVFQCARLPIYLAMAIPPIYLMRGMAHLPAGPYPSSKVDEGLQRQKDPTTTPLIKLIWRLADMCRGFGGRKCSRHVEKIYARKA